MLWKQLVIVARRISKATILELGLPRRANPDLDCFAYTAASKGHVIAPSQRYLHTKVVGRLTQMHHAR
jgi:hypothetical protein